MLLSHLSIITMSHALINNARLPPPPVAIRSESGVRHLPGGPGDAAGGALLGCPLLLHALPAGDRQRVRPDRDRGVLVAGRVSTVSEAQVPYHARALHFYGAHLVGMRHPGKYRHDTDLIKCRNKN